MLRPVPLAPLSSRPTVSVLIANYNSGRFIGEAIESVLGQTYPHFEIIVCDDGSEDDSCTVVNRYIQQDHRVHLIARANQGQASATATAYESAHGEIICLLDADDRFHPFKLAQVVAAFERQPTAGACIHRVLPVSTIGTPISEPIPPRLEEGWLAPMVLKTGLLSWHLALNIWTFISQGNHGLLHTFSAPPRYFVSTLGSYRYVHDRYCSITHGDCCYSRGVSRVSMSWRKRWTCSLSD